MIANELFHLAKADFLQRVRGPGFMVMMIVTVSVSTLFVPPADAGYSGLTLGMQRLAYNSTGIGLMFGFTISLLLSLLAFYLVRNGVGRDRQTRVGQVIAATPTRDVTYLVGKWASNLLLLVVVLTLMTVMAPIMQVLRGEDLTLQLGQLMLPIWLIGLPVMSVVAGVAVLFETIPLLRGGVGNIVYFFLWSFALVGLALVSSEAAIPLPDPFGLKHPLRIIYAMPNAPETLSVTLFSEPVQGGVLNVEAIQWPMGTALSRVVWVAVGAGLAAAGALPFDRFNPAAVSRSKPGLLAKAWKALQPTSRNATPDVTAFKKGTLTPLERAGGHMRLGGLLVAELRLLLKGQPWWWLAGLAGVIVYGAVAPFRGDMTVVVGVTIWPLLVWSAMGAREAHHGTTSLTLTTPHPILRHLPMAYLAGVLLGGLLMSGFALQMALGGAWLHLAALLSGVLVVPAAALTLGTWSGSPRLFEVAYLLWWYIAINAADVPGLHPMLITTPFGVLLSVMAAAVLLGAAAVGRARML